MADLPNRRKHEEDMARAIAEVLRKHRDEWTLGIDAPQTERDLTDQLKSLLLLLFLAGSGAAAGELGIAINARGAGGAWSNSYSTALARSIVGGISRRIQALRGANASAGQVGELVDKLQTAKRWAGVGATETTRANTAGGEFVAGIYNSQVGARAFRVLLPVGAEPPEPPEVDDDVAAEPALAIWNTREDDRVCPICAPMHGRPRDEWSQVFPLGPPAHPSCRCTVDYSR